MQPCAIARLSLPPQVLFLSGGPGVGKTTLATHLVTRLSQPVIVSLDDVRSFIPYNRPIPPTTAERRIILEAAACMARSFAEHHHQVIVEGVVPPALIQIPLSVLSGIAASVAFLHLPVAEALRRNNTREKVLPEWIVRSVHGEFSNLGRWEPYAVHARGSLDEVCNLVWQRWSSRSLEVAA